MKVTPDKSNTRMDGESASRRARTRRGDHVQLANNEQQASAAPTPGTVRCRTGSPRASGHVKTLTPPGPTSRPTTMRTMPSRTCTSKRGDDAGDDQDHGENPQQSGHETLQNVQRSPDGGDHVARNHLLGRLCTPRGVITVRRVKPRTAPVRVALVDDYDVVVMGLAHLFDAYRDRIVVAELDTNEPVTDEVDVVLYDSFAQPEADHDDIAVLVDNPHARHVVVYTWNFHPALVDSAMTKGASGYLSKTLPAHELVTAIEAIADGKVVISDAPPRSRPAVGLDWPGRTEGLTDREAEVLALVTQGKSNSEIAEVMYLSINTVKTYIRSAYRKIGVTGRSHAMLWGLDHGFQPDHHRIDHWRGGP